MKKSKKLLFPTLTLFVCLLMLVGTVWAWFVFLPSSNELFVSVGDIKLECEVYVAKDENKDTTPDILEIDDNDNKVPDVYENDEQLFPLSRTEVIERYYMPIDEHEGEFSDIDIGGQVLYKIVIKNNSKKSTAKIGLSFGDMTNYFYESVKYYFDYLKTVPSPTPDNLAALEKALGDEFFAFNSSRLLFNIKSRYATMYANPDNNYNDKVEAARQPDNGVLFPDSAVPLWGYSRGAKYEEKFIDGIMLESGELVEINFALSCDFLTLILNDYISEAGRLYLNKFDWTGYQQAALADAIDTIAEWESLYIYHEDITEGGDYVLKRMSFTVNKIYIHINQIK